MRYKSNNVKKKESAKDIAFEKERIKFRRTIRELTDCLHVKEEQINQLNEIIHEKEEIIREQKEWIDRLLEYTELSKEDLNILIKNEKEKTEIRENISTLLSFSKPFLSSCSNKKL